MRRTLKKTFFEIAFKIDEVLSNKNRQQRKPLIAGEVL